MEQEVIFKETNDVCFLLWNAKYKNWQSNLHTWSDLTPSLYWTQVFSFPKRSTCKSKLKFFFEYSCMTMQLLKMQRKLFQEQSNLLRFENWKKQSNKIKKTNIQAKLQKKEITTNKWALKNDARNSYLKKNFDFSTNFDSIILMTYQIKNRTLLGLKRHLMTKAINNKQ